MTISEFARRTIEEDRRRPRRFVAKPGLPSEFVVRDRTTLQPRSEGPCQRFPSSCSREPLVAQKPRKLFEAFRESLDRTGSLAELVLTGSPTGWPELRARYPTYLYGISLRRRSPVKLLYEGALALTFFSHFEGFGIPVLEAFASGTPVLSQYDEPP